MNLNNELLLNQSMLIDKLLQESAAVDGFTYDQIDNLYVYEEAHHYLSDIVEDANGNGTCTVVKASTNKIVATVTIQYESFSVPTYCNSTGTICDYLYTLSIVNFEGESFKTFYSDTDTGFTFTAESLHKYLVASNVLCSYDELKDDVEDCDMTPQEIYEWWVVTDWLADKLDAKGEPILRNDYGTWWGRTTTGQAIELDGVMQELFSPSK